MHMKKAYSPNMPVWLHGPATARSPRTDQKKESDASQSPNFLSVKAWKRCYNAADEVFAARRKCSYHRHVFTFAAVSRLLFLFDWQGIASLHPHTPLSVVMLPSTLLILALQ